MPFPSLFVRVAVGKGVGFLIGLAGFFMVPAFDPTADALLPWGVLLWYPTLGAVIGAFGVFDQHPVLKFPMPWWFRGPFIGGWMNLVLVFFAHAPLVRFMTAAFPDQPVLHSPFWFAAEGVVVGFLIGYAATRVGGEGPATVGA